MTLPVSSTPTAWVAIDVAKTTHQVLVDQYLYQRPGPDAPARYTWKGIRQWQRQHRSRSHPTHEVQCET